MRVLLPLLLVLLPAIPARAIDPLPSDRVLLVGRFARGPVDQPVTVGAAAFDRWFASTEPAAWPAEIQARQFFRNGGSQLEVVRVNPRLELAEALTGDFTTPTLRGAGWAVPFSDLGLLLLPELAELDPLSRNELLVRLQGLAAGRHFIVLLDPPPDVDTTPEALGWAASLPQDLDFAAALYPRVLVDPGSGSPVAAGPSGSVAPVVLRKDAAGGLWKAAAGTDAAILVEGLAPVVSSTDASSLNSANVCVIREFASDGTLLWGWRSRDTLDSENTFLNVSRLRRWIRHSLRRGLAGPTALQANDGALWSSLRLQSEAFLDGLHRQGAFQGATSRDAYFVRCDLSTTTAQDVAEHRVNLVVGFAPLKPAEFLVESIGLQTLDPTRTVPVGSLLLTGPPGGELRIFHTTSPGFTHRLRDSTTLGPGDWITRVNVLGDGSWEEYRPGGGPGRRFFRIESD